MIFGKETIINLYECRLITRLMLEKYAKELCKFIDMKPYGGALTPYFGTDFAKGYTLVQLIETSSIVGHFSEENNSAYINIFSCKPYDEIEAAEFTKNFFGAKQIEVKILERK